MLHSLAVAWRQLIANPLFSLITIASLSIGCCGALLAGANIKQHLSFERGFKDADRILLVRIRENAKPGTPLAANNNPVREGVFGYNLKPALKDDLEGKLPGMIAQTRVYMAGALLADERGEPTRDSTRFVDPEFFDVFDIVFVEGNKRTAFATPESIAITQSKARELFGDKPAFGQELTGVGRTKLKVGAVIADPPAPTMFDYKILGSVRTGLMTMVLSQPNWGSTNSGGHYIRIGPSVDRSAFIASANETIKAVAFAGRSSIYADMRVRLAEQLAKAGITPPKDTDFEWRVSLMPLTDIHLAPGEATGVNSSADTTMLMTLSAAAVALLAVSAFNYVVLSLARALRRRREVGVRKVLGASGGAIMRQYLGEASLVTTISVAVGFALAELLQPWFARTLGQPEILFNLYDPVFLAASIGGAVLLALMVGAYPALYLAHVRPRAGLENGGAQQSGRFGRSVTIGLLGLEIVAATTLLIVALTMALQARYVAARPLGFNLANLYAIQSNCSLHATPTLALSNPPCSRALDRIVRTTPGIRRVSYSSSPAIFTSAEPQPIRRLGATKKLGDGLTMAVDADFLPMAGAKLLAGRLFDARSAYDRRQIDLYPSFPDQPFDSIPVVATRAILPLLGATTPEDAIGQRIAPFGRTTYATSYEIVGVVEDWHQRSLKYAVSPVIFVPGGTMMQVVAEIAEADAPEVQRRLNPTGGFVLEGGFLRLTATPLQTAFAESYVGDRKLMAAIAGFAVVAMIVAGLGVFGLSAFDIQRRVREIGIRKALGATPAGVAGMVLRGSLASAAIASVAAWPVGWWLSSSWLNSYVYRTQLGLAVLPAASLVVLVFVALAVLVNTLRAAAIRPSAALRAA